jgi:hypothetical protein
MATTLDFSTTSSGPQVGAVIAHKGRVTSASFHEEGKLLYVAFDGTRVSVLDCETGKASSTTPFRFEQSGSSLVEAT